MSDNWLLGTIGYMAYYTLKPFLILHAILSTAWKAARMVNGLAAENASYSAAQAALVLPVFLPHHERPLSVISQINERPLSGTSQTHERPLSVMSQTHERPLSTLSQTHERSLSVISHTHERPLSVTSQTYDRPLSARYPSGYSLADLMLKQQLAEMETEKQQRWSRLPSYSLYDEHAEVLPMPPLSPGDFNYSRKPMYGGAQYSENDIKIVVYPVEKQSPLETVSQLSSIETMRYIPVAT